MLNWDKNHPSDEIIESIRRRFPVERDVDRILTRKMRQRSNGPYSPVSLETLKSGVESLIQSNHRGPFEVSDARWLQGGASKLQMAFSLSWNKPDVGHTKTPMVLRMQPKESDVETSRLREFQLVKAFEGIIPVPPFYWVDDNANHLPYPGLICGFVEGVTKPTHGVSGVAGAATNVGPSLRKLLGPQFLQHLSIIHNHDFTKCGLTAFDIPGPGKNAAELALNWWERVWEEDFEEDSPIMQYAASFMRENLPVCDRLSVVHGDYRIGNCLFNEQDGRITAWLDWELAHIGDRHEDLAWAIVSVFGHLAEDGKTFLCCGLMPEEELLEGYEKTSGSVVNRKVLQFYKILVNYKLAVLTHASCYRVARNGKGHHDALLIWLMGVAPTIMKDLCHELEKVT